MHKDKTNRYRALYIFFNGTWLIGERGHIMDKYGLKAAAIPSMLLMGLAFSLLSVVKGDVSLAAVALVFGVGNGICGGILNAFATGLTPRNARTQFLGLWILGTFQM